MVTTAKNMKITSPVTYEEINNPPLTFTQTTQNDISNLARDKMIEDIGFLITKTTNDSKDIYSSFRVVMKHGISGQDYEEAKQEYKARISDYKFIALHYLLMRKVRERHIYVSELSKKTGMSVDELTEVIINENIPNSAIMNVAMFYDFSKKR